MRKPGYWQQNHALLVEQCKTMSAAEIGEYHGRTEKAVRRILEKNKLTAQPAKPYWENRYPGLQQLVDQGMKSADLAKHYGVTQRSMRNILHLADLGSRAVRRLTKLSDVREEMEQLAKTMTSREMAKHYGVPESTMRTRLMYAGIKSVPMKYWWEGSREELRMLACKHSIIEMCNILGRTRHSVTRALKHFDLLDVKWSPDGEIAKACATMTAKEISEHFNVTINYVYAKLKKHGLKCKPAVQPVKEPKPKPERKPRPKRAPNPKQPKPIKIPKTLSKSKKEVTKNLLKDAVPVITSDTKITIIPSAPYQTYTPRNSSPWRVGF